MLAALLVFQAAQSMRFESDATRMRGISVNGACILGEDVHTSGIYLIGSADGSDAQGRSVISVGGSGGKMKSDNPDKVVPPPFQMSFQQKAWNKVAFSVSVGPVPQDFATISMPFDFGRKVMDRFAFAGKSYNLFCSENDGLYTGSGNSYDFIHPRCEIRDLAQKLIGKVGGASTESASEWGEVAGPYATVRVVITKSLHYEKLVFMNHPGTHNMEFSFGRMKQGESASLSGEITVTPGPGPDSWDYDAATELNHQVGRAEADGWSVRVGDEREKYLCFGPYATEIGAGPRVARFTLMLDNVSFDDAKILTIDVADASSGAVLAQADLTRSEAERNWREFQAMAKRPLSQRIRHGFIRTYKPVLDDAPYRSFETMEQYREWCVNLPKWRGFPRL